MDDAILDSVVIVGMMDSSHMLTSIASGFIVDARRGLVATVGHAVFDMINGGQIGKKLGTQPIIARVPSSDRHDATVCYFADIVASDIRNTDLCVLRIHSIVENGQFQVSGKPISSGRGESFQELSLADKWTENEDVSILGFPHGKVNNGYCLVPERIEGSIKGIRKVNYGDMIRGDSEHDKHSWQPCEEIVVAVSKSTTLGQGGGPCLNQDNAVVGILSRGLDNFAFVVPSSEIKRFLCVINK